MVRKSGVSKTKRLDYVDFFFQKATEKGVLDVNLT